MILTTDTQTLLYLYRGADSDDAILTRVSVRWERGEDGFRPVKINAMRVDNMQHIELNDDEVAEALQRTHPLYSSRR